MGAQGSLPLEWELDECANDEALMTIPPMYKNCGMVFPALSLRDVINLPLEQQAKQADAVTRRYVRNKKFLDGQFDDFDKGIDAATAMGIDPYNATSIGNIAYLVLHSNDPRALAAYDKIIAVVKGYKRGILEKDARHTAVINHAAKTLSGDSKIH
jgi:hypothetical protein